MQKTKNKYKTQNFMLVAFSVLIIALACLGVTGAWFTANKQGQIKGQTPKISIATMLGSENKKTYTISTATAGVFDASGKNENNKLTIVYSANIQTYVRVKVACSWVNGGDSDTNIFDVVRFNLGDSSNWITKNGASTDNQKIQSGWLYYKAKLSAVETETPQALEVIDSINISEAYANGEVRIQIYAEIVQGNDLGLKKFGDPPSALGTVE